MADTNPKMGSNIIEKSEQNSEQNVELNAKQVSPLQKPGVLCVGALVACFLWGSAFPSIKIGYNLFNIADSDTMSQMLFAGYRFTLSGIIVILIGSLMQKRFIHPKKSSIGMVFTLAAFQTVIQYFFFYMGLAHTSGIKASIINAANVFFALFLSALVFKEKLTSRKIIGCVIGFAGVVIINLSGGSLESGFSIFGEGFMILAALSSATSSVLIKKFSQNEDTFTLCGYQFFVGGLVLTILGLARGGSVTGFTLPSTGLLVYLAFVSSIAYSLWSLLLKYNPVSRVSIYGFSNPMFGVILSAIFLGEKNQAFTLIGLLALVLVCVGIMMVNRESE